MNERGPGEIRREIEETREALGETTAAATGVLLLLLLARLTSR